MAIRSIRLVVNDHNERQEAKFIDTVITDALNRTYIIPSCRINTNEHSTFEQHYHDILASPHIHSLHSVMLSCFVFIVSVARVMGIERIVPELQSGKRHASMHRQV